jgi:hypothetical protein
LKAAEKGIMMLARPPWRLRRRNDPRKDMPYVIVEYEFNPPITDAGLQQMTTSFALCAGARHIRKLRSVISIDRRRGYCEFEAPDVETVREAFRSAKIEFRSAWTAHLFDANPPSE